MVSMTSDQKFTVDFNLLEAAYNFHIPIAHYNFGFFFLKQLSKKASFWICEGRVSKYSLIPEKNSSSPLLAIDSCYIYMSTAPIVALWIPKL